MGILPRMVRRFRSLATELVKKAREALLTAVQIFNNPQIEFKSELFIVSTIIAWTYLLHAYYRKQGIEYRRFTAGTKRRRFLRTKHGAIYRWSLEECLDCPQCPLEDIVKKNLRFLIGVRHEIEHQMTTRIDDQLSAKFQAAALNFNTSLKGLFGVKYGLDHEQAFSIQFSGIDESTAKELLTQSDLPKHIRSFIVQFETGLTQDEFDDPKFSYRVAFVRKTSNSKVAADKVVEFIPPDSSAAMEINKVFLKETEKKKYRPGTIVKLMKADGYPRFGMQHHTDLWKAKDGKNPKHQYGTQVEGNWYWYEPWVNEVRKYCQENAEKYKSSTAPSELPTSDKL